MSTLWGPSRVLGYFHLVEWCLRLYRDLERLWWKLFILVNLDFYLKFTRTTLASGQVGRTVTTVCGQDDDILCIQLSLSSSGGERVRGNTQFPGSRSSHGTPGLSPRGRRTHRSTHARSLVSMGFRLRPRTLRLRFYVRTPHRAILPWARYHRIDPLGLSHMPGGGTRRFYLGHAIEG